MLTKLHSALGLGYQEVAMCWNSIYQKLGDLENTKNGFGFWNFK